MYLKISTNKKTNRTYLSIASGYREPKTGKTKTELEKISRQEPPKYDYKVFAIDYERSKLYDRINYRVEKMLEEGLIEEVENIKNEYKEFPTAMQGLGYKEVVDYIEKRCSYEEMVEKIKQETRRYAKRQVTWFKGIKELTWLDAKAGNEKNIELILEEINWKKR